MPKLKTYHVFISHSWKYSDEYDRLVALLNAAPNFAWANYSVPEGKSVVEIDKPVGKRRLRKELKEQIHSAHVVLVIAGMYVNHKYWIQAELDLSVAYPKPIIAIVPYGHERVPEELQAMATAVVGWNTNSIVKAIRKHAL